MKQLPKPDGNGVILKVPIIAIIIGEGGSGGALTLAVANRVWMLENSNLRSTQREGCLYPLEGWRSCYGSGGIDENHFMNSLEMGIVDKVISEARSCQVKNC